MRDEIHAANYRTLRQALQVDPHQWMAGGRCWGWEFEFWSVSLDPADPGAGPDAGEARLAAVSVLERDVPGHRQWLEAFEAIAAAVAACPTFAYGQGRSARLDGATLFVRCCGDWASEQRDDFDAVAGDAIRSSLRVEVTTNGGDEFSLDDEIPVLYGTMTAIDEESGDLVEIEVAATPLGPLAEIDEQARDYRRRDWVVTDDPDELWETATAVGALVDRWCPIPTATAVPAQWADADVQVSLVSMDSESLAEIAAEAGRDRLWWCRWCDDLPLGTFVVGDPADGIACCEAHISDAAAVERREMCAAG